MLVSTQESAQGTIVVLNANTLAVSEYGITALDVLEHEGEVYFVTATGLVKLDAAGTESVSAWIETGDLDLAGLGSVAFHEARLGLVAEGDMHLTLTAHQDGGERAVVYQVPARSGAQARERVVRLGRGVFGNAWRIKLADGQNKGPWALDEAALRVSATRQRRR